MKKVTESEALAAGIEEKQFIPFSNGTELMMWYDRNCDVCSSFGGCKLEEAIALGTVTGTIPESVIDKIGFTRKEDQKNGSFCTLNTVCNMLNGGKDPNQTSLF